MIDASETSLHSYAHPMGANVYPELKSEKGEALAGLLSAYGFPVHRIASLWDCDHDRMAEVIATSRRKADEFAEAIQVSRTSAPPQD